MFATSSKRVLPGFGISLGSSLFFTCLILLLPISALLMQLSQMTLAQYWEVITNPQVVAAYEVTLLAAGVALAVLIDFPFELGLGYYAGKWSQTYSPMRVWSWAFVGRRRASTSRTLRIIRCTSCTPSLSNRGSSELSCMTPDPSSARGSTFGNP